MIGHLGGKQNVEQTPELIELIWSGARVFEEAHAGQQLVSLFTPYHLSIKAFFSLSLLIPLLISCTFQLYYMYLKSELHSSQQ